MSYDKKIEAAISAIHYVADGLETLGTGFQITGNPHLSTKMISQALGEIAHERVTESFQSHNAIISGILSLLQPENYSKVTGLEVVSGDPTNGKES